MRGILGLLKVVYYRNKLFFIITLIAILVLIAGCSTQGGAPPSGPIGGGCS